MIHSIFWTAVFFFWASFIAIQPACQNWQQKPLHKVRVKVSELEKKR